MYKLTEEQQEDIDVLDMISQDDTLVDIDVTENVRSFDSKEELYFSWYLDELQSVGIIYNWVFHPIPLQLSDKVNVRFLKKMQTKTKFVERCLLQDHTYEADFQIHWNPKWEGNFYCSHDNECYDIKSVPFIANGHTSLIDTKGKFNRNDTHRRFSVEQKWIWNNFNLYVQKIIVPEIFFKTFVPSRYLLTDVTKKERKLPDHYLLLDDYINKLLKI